MTRTRGTPSIQPKASYFEHASELLFEVELALGGSTVVFPQLVLDEAGKM
jgi:hypothetical protein